MKFNTLDWAHPLVQEWFHTRLGEPTEPQKLGWASILKGKNTLIAASTGSGKTLAAFLVCINKLIQSALNHSLSQKTEILYISPLKALSNDIQKNLTEPLLEIQALALKKGLRMQAIDVGLRTGDTQTSERQKMLKKPPHILVTTPESLYILLTAEKSRETLTDIKTVIVDEVHALFNNKRGTHLTLSLERLEAMTKQSPLRIGLSATQKPLTVVAQFLTGNRALETNIINTGHLRTLEMNIEVPNSELGPVASNELWDEIYDKIAVLAQRNRSTLVFVNTRRLSERVAHHLAERLGEEKVTAHHGSLSRKLRLSAETRLKNGELNVLVATASLELGIDIGSIDLVCQISSPRAINVALQRVGRAGHWHQGISKGIFFPTTRDELLECAALIYAIRDGEMDKLIFPKASLDILCQQIVASVATQDWNETELYTLIRKAYPYADLSLEKFDTLLTMLSEGVAGSRGRYGAYLFRDHVNGLVKARRGARLTAITNGGSIPETGLFSVLMAPEDSFIGTLDEDFAIESNRGDIILLGNNSWKIQRIESQSGKVLVEDAHGAPPSVPFWQGESFGRTQELSVYICLLRDKLATANTQDPNCITWLQEQCGLDTMGAEQLIDYVSQGKTVLGAVPTQNTIVAERFFDESGGMQLIIHAPFGMRINKAWGLALRKKFCRSFNFELQASATDNGLNICLTEQHSFPLQDVFKFLHPNSIKEVLTQAVLQSPVFNTRWRWTACRALALLRCRSGKKVPPNLLRMLSDDLLAAVFPEAAACQDNLGGKEIELPDHPLIEETMTEIFTDALDLEGLSSLLQAICSDEITCHAVDTPIPSVFSHEILNANPYAFIDDAPLEERRARAVNMRRILPETLLEDIGKLDPLAIEEVQQQVWPDIRNADELQDFLQTVIALPQDSSGALFPLSFQNPTLWHSFFEELVAQGRAGMAEIQGQPVWFCAEKKEAFSLIYPKAHFIQACVGLPEIKNLNTEAALTQLIRGWVQHLGPTHAQELSQLLKLDTDLISTLLLQLESSGLILRGHFVKNDSDCLEWCERRLLARIHKLTLGKLRKSIQPVSAAEFVRWLLNWQHVAPGTQLKEEAGLLEIIRKLQGFELPAHLWEKEIFSKRIKNYHKDLLDHLCLTGQVGFGRLSMRSPFQAAERRQNGQNHSKKINTSNTIPITFFIYSESEWIQNYLQAPHTHHCVENLSPIATKIFQYLQEKGASFINQMLRHFNHLETELENGLFDLVAQGLVTADSFDNLRVKFNPRRKLNRLHPQRWMRARTGRWSVLQLEPLDTQKTTLNEQTLMESLCWNLLKRYGIVFRDILVREKNLPRWRDLLKTFRRLEDRGEIRGGRFVTGFLGDQFALPIAVDALRQHVKHHGDATPVPISISAADPLNLYGIILPGQKIASNSKTTVTV